MPTLAVGERGEFYPVSFFEIFSIFFNFAKRMWADEDVFLGDLFKLQNPLYASGLIECFWLFFAGTH